jgi:hypothetical protein
MTDSSKKKCDEPKGFSYSLEDEKILSYMKLTAGEKLQWLEDINRFTFLVLNDRQKEFRELLRSGKI